jgi:hypothetical protein
VFSIQKQPWPYLCCFFYDLHSCFQRTVASDQSAAVTIPSFPAPKELPATIWRLSFKAAKKCIKMQDNSEKWLPQANGLITKNDPNSFDLGYKEFLKPWDRWRMPPHLFSADVTTSCDH